ncbi:MAG: hypothetical protein HDT43_05790 [Ruminococcaceae bacterium]|nr:hypothetical protein [Oscillospiraceae bacterium]
MDKRDFYREIMENYTFDKNKIYTNAKKGKFTGNYLRRQPLPIYIGMTAAVAAVAVTVGTITATRLDKRNVIDGITVGSSYAALSNEERIKKGQEEARDNESSKELFDVLVSFERPVSSAEVQRVLLARSEGSVPVKALYMEDGTAIVGIDNVGALFNGNGISGITGAKIRCAGYLMSQLQSDSLVLAVEIINNNDTPELIVPIVTDNSSVVGDISGDSSQSSDVISDSSTDNESTSSVSTVNSSTELPESSSSDNNVSEPTAPPVYEIENHISAVDGGYSPAVAHNENISSPMIPIDVLMALSDDAQLPFDPGRFSYLTEDMGAKQAYFLNDNTLYVRTENDIRLYTVTGGEAVLAVSQECADTTVFWIAENGGRLLALGSDGNLYDVDANSGKINVVSLESAIGAGIVYDIAYNEETGILALNVFKNDNYELVICDGGFDEANVKTLYSSPTAFSLIAANYGIGGTASVYFAAYSGSDLLLYNAYSSEEPTFIGSLQGKYDITHNAAFTHAVISGGMIDLLFDPASYALISIADSNVQFGVSKHSFLGADGYYTINNGEKTPSGGISVISKLDFKRSLSQYYMAAAENGAVRIVNGIYTDRAKNDYLTYEVPEENASMDMRAAVNAAVGLQNALACGLCESCGITDKAALENLIAHCFSDTAAESLKARCAVGEGETLEYTSGRIYSINLSDTVLVISEETETGANGTLYINAGSFDGRTAYYSCAVKLQKTESGYKADCVIE